MSAKQYTDRKWKALVSALHGSKVNNWNYKYHQPDKYTAFEYLIVTNFREKFGSCISGVLILAIPEKGEQSVFDFAVLLLL